ncbi:MAG: hypothetical protein RIE56_02880 [Amphiplicatus sp.]
MFGSILRKFSSAADETAFADGQWPREAVVSALEGRFESVSHVGDDEGFGLYGVTDRGVNFVVGLLTPVADRVTEIAFVARFAGFGGDARLVEGVNRNLHLSIASLEANGEIYLIAGIEAAGAFNRDAFMLLLDTWRRDLMILLHALSGGSSLMQAFPAARSERALKFATNEAPKPAEGEEAGAPADLLKAYLAAGPSLAVCGACEGRGKTGFIARQCPDCSGSGFIAERRPAR